MSLNLLLEKEKVKEEEKDLVVETEEIQATDPVSTETKQEENVETETVNILKNNQSPLYVQKDKEDVVQDDIKSVNLFSSSAFEKEISKFIITFKDRFNTFKTG